MFYIMDNIFNNDVIRAKSNEMTKLLTTNDRHI